jgi:hypothetical protein
MTQQVVSVTDEEFIRVIETELEAERYRLEGWTYNRR